ncbi:MAG: (Fe-S)-binding protein [Desulfobacterales bacterium]|jgi:Fe-S oxidoreductase|nr:(Fe-S)-binding protein [Desulfobacterales bacterium]
MQYEEFLHRCFRCGYCKLPSNYTDINCPSYLAFRFETFSPGGRMWLLRGWLENKIPSSARFSEIMFSCATCGNCKENCAFPEFKDYLLQIFTAGKEKLLDGGHVPAAVRDYLTKMQLHGNPYAMPSKKRFQWAEGSGIAPFSNHEYLLFVDDVGAYDPRGREIARSVAKLLQRAGVSFGVMMENLVSDGNDVKAMGETLLFEDLARQNITALNASGVKKIITVSPHTFNTLKNDYPALGGQYQVHHYSQIMAFAMGKLMYMADLPPLRVTFHDPCYLGRHNTDYESPRMILRSLPGVKVAEMDRNRKNALCCGGGGGNFFTDLLSGVDDSPARVRVRDAAIAGADVLAVACPQCAVMLEDALKTEGLGEKLRVMEMSEIIRERIL